MPDSLDGGNNVIKHIATKLLAFLMVVALLAPAIPAAATGESVGGSATSPVHAPSVTDSVYLLGSQKVKKPSQAGALQLAEIDGQLMLADEGGNPVQLRGMSTHGLQWYPDIVNDNAFAALADDWGANMIRLAMYVGESGYASDPETIKARVIQGIDYAIDNDMYVIVDWHVHAPGDPRADVYAGAMDFFEEISALYPNNPHIIYELANEPSSNNTGGPGLTNDAAGWAAVKEYAQPIVNMLRAEGNENIVIVGSPNWSQRPDLAVDNPIVDPLNRTMYTIHFYSGTHGPATDGLNRENVMSNAIYALEHGLALFATEWGTSEASGNNGPFLDEADVWLGFLNHNNISWANWSLTNKNETSAAFTPFVMGQSTATALDPGDDQTWATGELSVSGEYVRARIKGIAYEPIDRTPREEFSAVVWDFDDGTTQGFGKNVDSPNDLVLSNAGNRLQIEGLGAGGIWDYRISSDGRNPAANIAGAQSITAEIIVDEPATVRMAAIPQSNSAGWASPSGNGGEVTASDFAEQLDGSYKAVLTMSGNAAPNLAIIGNDATDNVLTNIILLLAAEDTTVIAIDNITVHGNRAVVQQPIEHAPAGTAALPSDFEDGTRQGWTWSADSGVKSALTIEEANGSKAISWAYAYPEVKPTDNWASAPRLDLWKDSMTLGNNDYVSFDLYLATEPTRGTEGAIAVNLIFQAEALGWWGQAPNAYRIELSELDSAVVTEDGLYHYEVKLRARDIPNIADDLAVRNMILLFADADSNFAGRVYVDNVRLEPSYAISVGTLAGGTIAADKQSAAAGETIELTITPDEGFRLVTGSLKYTSGETETAISGTSFAMPASDIAITAAFERIPTHTSGSYTPPAAAPKNDSAAVVATVDANGKAAAAVTSEQMANAVDKAIKEAGGRVAINVDAPKDAKAVELSIPQAAFNLVAEKQAGTLTIASPIATLTFDSRAITAIVGAATADITITAARVDASALSEETRKAIGDKPVFDFTVKSGSRTISEFGGNVTVAVPYEPGADEDVHALIIYYVNEQGKLETVRDSVFEPATGTVTFKTNHFSQYAVGYNKIAFSDVSGWYEEAVIFLAARNVMKGQAPGVFAPTAGVTRAEFVQMLANTAGAAPGSTSASAFTDVQPTAWYSGAVQWAYENGIATGHAGKFNPGAGITRQEMAVMFKRYLDKVAKSELAVSAEVAPFSDEDAIAGYAKGAVTALHRAGIIAGKDNNLFHPATSVTRAEAAKLIAAWIQSTLKQ